MRQGEKEEREKPLSSQSRVRRAEPPPAPLSRPPPLLFFIPDILNLERSNTIEDTPTPRACSLSVYTNNLKFVALPVALPLGVLRVCVDREPTVCPSPRISRGDRHA